MCERNTIVIESSYFRLARVWYHLFMCTVKIDSLISMATRISGNVRLTGMNNCGNSYLFIFDGQEQFSMKRKLWLLLVRSFSFHSYFTRYKAHFGPCLCKTHRREFLPRTFSSRMLFARCKQHVIHSLFSLYSLLFDRGFQSSHMQSICFFPSFYLSTYKVLLILVATIHFYRDHFHCFFHLAPLFVFFPLFWFQIGYLLLANVRNVFLFLLTFLSMRIVCAFFSVFYIFVDNDFISYWRCCWRCSTLLDDIRFNEL